MRATDMTRGKIRGRGCRLIKRAVRGTSATRLNMPTVPISSPQQGGTSFSEGPILGPSNAPPVQRLHHSGTPTIHFEPIPTTPNQRIREDSSTQSNTVGEDVSSSIRGGEKKRRVVGLGSEAKYYGPNNLRVSYESDASSSAPPSNPQSYVGTLDELVVRLVPDLLDRMLPILAERAREMISSQSQQPNTRTDPLSAVAPDAPTAIVNVNERHASGSNSDHNPSA